MIIYIPTFLLSKYFIDLIILNSNIGISKEKDESKLKLRLSYWLGTYWIDFDNVYMKPKLIYNWPNVKDEHDQISKIIKTVTHDYSVSKPHIDKKDGLTTTLHDDFNHHGLQSMENHDFSRLNTKNDE